MYFFISLHLRLGVFINLILPSSAKLVEPQPITMNDMFRGRVIVARDFVWRQIGLTLLAIRTGVLSFRIATSL